MHEIRKTDVHHRNGGTRRAGHHQSVPQRVEAPGQLARALAMTWSYCVWTIADSEHQVAPEFRNSIIEQYLVFVLKLGWQPSEIFMGLAAGNAEGLDVWRDLFLSELQARFLGADSTKQKALKDAFESLDQGKSYVLNGSTCLEEKLFG